MRTCMSQLVIIAQSVCLPSILVGLGSPQVAARPDGRVFERVVIEGDIARALCCARAAMPGKPLLAVATQSQVELYDVFGGSQPLSNPHFGWTLGGGDVAFKTSSIPRLGLCHITRYPLFALIHPLPPSANPFDVSKLSPEWINAHHPDWIDSSFADVFSYELIMQGGVKWTEEGLPGNVATSRKEVIFLDIVGQSRTSVRLFMTVDSDLSIWETSDRQTSVRATDGRNWRLIRDHAGTIKGPFLALDNGKSFVAAQDDDWGVFGKAHGNQLQFTPLVRREGDEPLLVVEDRDGGVNYFVHNGVILDGEGDAMERLPSGLSEQGRLGHLLRFAIDHRPVKPKP